LEALNLQISRPENYSTSIREIPTDMPATLPAEEGARWPMPTMWGLVVLHIIESKLVLQRGQHHTVIGYFCTPLCTLVGTVSKSLRAQPFYQVGHVWRPLGQQVLGIVFRGAPTVPVACNSNCADF
jgi:hypothetical protein